MLKEPVTKIRELHFKTIKTNPLAKKLRAKQEESFLKIYKRSERQSPIPGAQGKEED